jgi:hypothetical protein
VAHVCDVSQTLVDGEAPWVAETFGPNFRSAVPVGVRIVGWNAIRIAPIDIEAED